ncbi:hypothetical protein D7B24_006600 [Verticillium nonalfalfae]|uniref:C2H2-type domain-containing protein n=1 Tax=Verticillium nonalfalfae TaxID=1051616 RepID=A0A3M9Y9B1_9PEZI|nr:uncharacterized protein D7B24_003337 [Verticillium nonalfalfae]XP_028495112.1 uncharacterized protein D7B24_006600 [Verticillium nonalfalfae]RNJ52539.1 hypothetical protein D7B24_003337 [Verticillium nonalfalfae]RNJ56954.1 hypothetical protein D7B24_006600 [Verticillium nonalfalfae]
MTLLPDDHWLQQQQQPQHDSGYLMMEPSVFPQYVRQRTQYATSTSQYDPRTIVTSGAIVAPHIAPDYVTGPTYGISPVSNIKSHFPVQAHNTYGQYDQPAGCLAMTYSRMSPQKEHAGLCILHQIPQQPIQGHRRQQQSLSAAGITPKTSDPMKTKEITYNKPVMADDIVFTTPVDVMMKALQKRKDKRHIANSNSSEAGTCSVKTGLSSPHPSATESSQEVTDKAKKYSCPFDGCAKSFQQSTHLETHKRAHTGDKPYTHNKTKPFACKLDNCNKLFTTRGNLKNHQNKYHGDTIGRLVDWIVSLTDVDALSPEDSDLLWYFSNIYKNSNKGIKGRGRDRRVSKVRMRKTKLFSSGMGLSRSRMLDSTFSHLE